MSAAFAPLVRYGLVPLVVLLAGAAHMSMLAGSWFADDAALVQEHPGVAGGPARLGDIARDGRYPPTSKGRPFRPVTLVSLSLDRVGAAGGEFGAGRHLLVNLLLLAAVAVAFLAVLRRRLPGRGLGAGIAALLVVVHPVFVPALVVGGRAELLAVLFSLLATLAWWRAGREGVLWWPVALLLFVLALGAKETAAVLPFVLLLIGPPPTLPRPRHAGRMASVVLLLPAALWLLFAWSGPEPASELPHAGAATSSVLALAGLAKQAVHVVLPVGVDPHPSHAAILARSFSPSPAAVGMAAVLALAALFLFVRALLGKPTVAGALLGVALVLAAGHAALGQPAATFDPAAALPLALPLLALVGLLLAPLLRPGAASRGVGVALFGLVLGGLGVLSHGEAQHYAGESSALERSLVLDPDNVVALERLARRHLTEAEELSRQAALLPASDPSRPELLAKGQRTKQAALAAALRAEGHPAARRRAPSAVALGLALQAMSRPAEALPHLLRAARLGAESPPPIPKPGGPDIPAAREAGRLYAALARAFQQTGEPHQAIEPLLMAVRLDPDSVDTARTAGLALNAAGRYGEGLALLEIAHDMARGSIQRELRRLIEREEDTAARRLADLLQEGDQAKDAGRYTAAQSAYEAAVRLAPNAPAALWRLGMLAGAHFGRFEEGLDRLSRAQELLEQAGESADAAMLRKVVAARADLAERLRVALERERAETPGGS